MTEQMVMCIEKPNWKRVVSHLSAVIGYFGSN